MIACGLALGKNVDDSLRESNPLAERAAHQSFLPSSLNRKRLKSLRRRHFHQMRPRLQRLGSERPALHPRRARTRLAVPAAFPLNGAMPIALSS